jgi:hypothetical protein
MATVCGHLRFRRMPTCVESYGCGEGSVRRPSELQTIPYRGVVNVQLPSPFRHCLRLPIKLKVRIRTGIVGLLRGRTPSAVPSPLMSPAICTLSAGIVGVIVNSVNRSARRFIPHIFNKTFDPMMLAIPQQPAITDLNPPLSILGIACVLGVGTSSNHVIVAFGFSGVTQSVLSYIRALSMTPTAGRPLGCQMSPADHFTDAARAFAHPICRSFTGIYKIFSRPLSEYLFSNVFHFPIQWNRRLRCILGRHNLSPVAG